MEAANGPDQPLAEQFDDELRRFAEDLRDLRISCGNPSLRELGRLAPPARPLSPTALSEAFNGLRLPRLDFVVATVRIILTLARRRRRGRPRRRPRRRPLHRDREPRGERTVVDGLTHRHGNSTIEAGTDRHRGRPLHLLNSPGREG